MANSRVTHGAGKLADKLVQKDGTVNPMAAKAISKLLSVQPVSYTHLTLPTTPYV